MGVTKAFKNSLRLHVSLLALVLAILVTLASQPVHGRQEEALKIGDRVLVTVVEGVIGTHTEELIKQAITLAESERAMLVLLLNTPGGLLDSAINIVYMVDEARIPVVSFVVGKWAVSAGTMILVCSHVAAMQPGTIIGSMQPIAYNPMTGTYMPVNDSKIINPILKVLDEHAGVKNRNMTAIHRFVTENLNLGAYEAKEYGVIDVVASDVRDLLTKINGMEVILPYKGITYVVDTSNAKVTYYTAPIRTRIVAALSDPLLSSLLLTFGFLVLLLGLLSGNYVIAPVGVLMLLLGLLGSGFNVNYVSVALIAIGATMLAIELLTPGFGVLGVTGVVMLAIGVAISPAGGGYAFSREYAMRFLYTAYAIGGLLGAFFGFAIYKVLKVKTRRPAIWSVVGKEGRAVESFGAGKEGFVMVEGELWRAVSDEAIGEGDTVVVLAKEGPLLRVRKKTQQATSS